jgi:lysozyme
MDIDLLVTELRRDEGVRYNPYRDTKNILTTGVGHNMESDPLSVGTTFPLSDDQVNALLVSDIQTKAIDPLNNYLPWWTLLDEVRQRILANLMFNMGPGTLLEFHHTLAAMESGDYVTAAAGMRNSAWAKEVGARADRLATAMETGVMP